jgi:glycosyltransferase involved in cell wall biosynthesis
VTPRVSVITPVRDGAADIAALLACLERQTLPRSDWEIVIGDDGSRDGGTDAIATPDGHVRVAAGPPRNSYAARARAVGLARAPVLAFCDADCRPEPDWLERGLARLAETDVVLGRFRFAVSEPRTVWTLLDMDGSKDHEHQVAVGVGETANLFVRRELYDGVGGLDGSIAEYGDFEFVERCVASGAELAFGDDVVVWHPTRSTRSSLLRALWKYNRGYAVHAGRRGEIPDAVKLRSWAPVVQTLRGRRRWSMSIGPDRRWLGENDVVPTRRETLVALPLMYVVIPYLRSAAQLAGWREGRRLRRRGERPRQPSPRRADQRSSEPASHIPTRGRA